ncbi:MULTISPECIES: YcnI family protein [unclassified Salinibacterium]|uniref:YcnI family copper-binding membrane protein n=1 Tax=unclassified Salinibacterium TaxID=2632331 RepID=UPI001420A5F5|nr:MULTISPECIES: YcnI family protein [unclassified Salinibacterium]
MTTTRTLAASATALGGALALALIPAAGASAHVTASATSTAAGSHTVVTFSVPHGCEGSPTLVVDIDIPDTIASVTPTINPNWTVTKNMVDDRVDSVTYTAIGAGLADGYRDAFELSLQLPDGEAGDAVEFPVTQTCAEGTETWEGDEVPTVILSEATGAGHDHDHGAAAEHADEATASASTGSETGGDDLVARIIAITGVLVGVIGLIVGVTARRTQKAG